MTAPVARTADDLPPTYPASRAVARPPADGVKEVLGVDRIPSSTDYPYVFAPDTQRAFLAGSGIGAEDQDKIAGGNWERLTGARAG